MSTRAAREGCGRARAAAAGQRGQHEEDSNERQESGKGGGTQIQRHGPRESGEGMREGRDEGRRPQDEANEREGGAESAHNSTNRHPTSHHHN